jgi:RNA polymerase-binding transcription factor DksA
MADEVDKTEVRVSLLLEADLAQIRNRAQAMPKGEPGECVLCGEESPRLVKGVCAPCRDKYKLP